MIGTSAGILPTLCPLSDGDAGGGWGTTVGTYGRNAEGTGLDGRTNDSTPKGPERPAAGTRRGISTPDWFRDGGRTGPERPAAGGTTEPAWLRDGGRTKPERPAAGTKLGNSGRTRITIGGTTAGTWGFPAFELTEDSA
jgi:hypothetical protein